jgi:hypothetical protein
MHSADECYKQTAQGQCIHAIKAAEQMIDSSKLFAGGLQQQLMAASTLLISPSAPFENFKTDADTSYEKIAGCDVMTMSQFTYASCGCTHDNPWGSVADFQVDQIIEVDGDGGFVFSFTDMSICDDSYAVYKDGTQLFVIDHSNSGGNCGARLAPRGSNRDVLTNTAEDLPGRSRRYCIRPGSSNYDSLKNSTGQPMQGVSEICQDVVVKFMSDIGGSAMIKGTQNGIGGAKLSWKMVEGSAEEVVVGADGSSRSLTSEDDLTFGASAEDMAWHHNVGITTAGDGSFSFPVVLNNYSHTSVTVAVCIQMGGGDSDEPVHVFEGAVGV